MVEKVCPTCKNPFKKSTKYCKAECYHTAPVSEGARQKMSVARKGRPKSADTRARMSASAIGRPKPWQRGEANPNFGNKAQGAPGVRERFLEASKARGLAWSEEDRQRHSETMKGPSNKMRGAQHTPKTKARISATKQKQYREGTVRIKTYKLSQAERQIAAYLTKQGIEFQAQFHIKGEPYLYDFYFPATQTVMEYQGDYWHANPSKYPSGTMLPIQNAGPVLVDTIWDRDRRKREAAERHGFKVVYVWERDFKAQGMGMIGCLVR